MGHFTEENWTKICSQHCSTVKPVLLLLVIIFCFRSRACVTFWMVWPLANDDHDDVYFFLLSFNAWCHFQNEKCLVQRYIFMLMDEGFIPGLQTSTAQHENRTKLIITSFCQNIMKIHFCLSYFFNFFLAI